MTPSRMSSCFRFFTFAVVGCALAVSGCSRDPGVPEPQASDAEPRNPTLELAERGAALPPPSPEHIEYDPQTNTLKLYQLPGSARWLVQLPRSATAIPAAARHRLPNGVDPDRTYVFYSTPNGHLSSYVTLRQIEHSQSKPHSSHAP